MRVLMVLANMGDSDRPAVWAKRQIDSLRKLGVDTETYLFKNRRSVHGLVRGGLTLRRMAREFNADGNIGLNAPIEVLHQGLQALIGFEPPQQHAHGVGQGPAHQTRADFGIHHAPGEGARQGPESLHPEKLAGQVHMDSGFRAVQTEHVMIRLDAQ